MSEFGGEFGEATAQGSYRPLLRETEYDLEMRCKLSGAQIRAETLNSMVRSAERASRRWRTVAWFAGALAAVGWIIVGMQTYLAAATWP